MATEDIDLTWRLLLAGWQTAYEPRALVGMEVPSTLGGLWAQRKRWARGQGEVLHERLPEICRWRHRRMWLLSIESVASLVWVLCLAAALIALLLDITIGSTFGLVDAGLAWGIAISVVATVQLGIALVIGHAYDDQDFRPFLFGPLYPLVYWVVSAAAAVRCQVLALATGPRDRRVVWDLEREALPPDAAASPPGG
jgi:biofilm PGA synthesis N-glycosyltransferase PgaC